MFYYQVLHYHKNSGMFQMDVDNVFPNLRRFFCGNKCAQMSSNTLVEFRFSCPSRLLSTKETVIYPVLPYFPRNWHILHKNVFWCCLSRKNILNFKKLFEFSIKNGFYVLFYTPGSTFCNWRSLGCGSPGYCNFHLSIATIYVYDVEIIFTNIEHLFL